MLPSLVNPGGIFGALAEALKLTGDTAIAKAEVPISQLILAI
ncbi:MAG: hypothetical protein PUP90_27505 [Nostoc sp. S4]|nr:hypothetical protein [Nostoc sp. S4]